MSTEHPIATRLSPNLTLEPPAPAPERPAPVFERLHALVRKGYVPEIGVDTETDIVVLRHVGRAPDLILHGNGVVEGFAGRRPRYKRDVEPPAAITTTGQADELRFLRFIESVPPASFRDRTRKWRHKFLYFPLFLMAVWGACMALTALVLGM